MQNSRVLQGWRSRILLWGVIIAASLFAVLFAVVEPDSAQAATTVPTKMNFQGRITNSAGNILANGTYNMRFKIYNALTSGTLQWSEDRLVSAAQGVTVTNGQFSVQLGDVSSLPASIFSSNSLYFEVELPTPATATSSSPTWTEGPMSPRNQLATSAYAYNAETLDGIDGASFAQLGTSNAFTGTNSINVANANAFQTKNGTTNLFNVDTTNSILTVGANDTTGAVLVLDVKSGAGDPTGGSATNGAMYYNANANKFRCYENGWTDCITAPATLQGAYDNSGTPATITTTAAKGVSIVAGAAPTADLFTVDNSSQPTTTAGVSGIEVNYAGGAAAVEGSGIQVDYAPGGTTGGTWNGMKIIANATGAASGVEANGLLLEGPTSGGAGTDTALKVATGWDIGLDIASGGMQLADEAEPSTPGSGKLRIYAKSLAGRVLLRQKGPSGVATPLQPSLFQNQICMVSASTGTTLSSFGCGTTNSTTLSHPAPTEATGYMTNFATSTSSGNESGFMTSVSQFFRGSTAGSNGYFFSARTYTVDTTSLRIFVGLHSQTTLANMMASDDPTGSRSGFAFSTVRGDTNWQFSVKNGTTQNLINTGMAYAGSKVYDMYFFVPPYPGNGTMYWRIDNLTDNTSQEGSTTSNLPAGNTALRVGLGVETQTTAARNFRMQRVYVETDR